MALYGVIDIGSNTIRLMVYRIENDELHPVLNNKFSAGLAGYVTLRGKLNKAGIAKAIEVLSELRTVTDQIALEVMYPFATASLRNISNTEEVLAAIQKATGFQIRVLSGEEEAFFDYYGAIQSTAVDSRLLVDVGGGSTELVSIQHYNATKGVSIPVGSLNLYTRFVDGILPSRSEIRRIQEEVDKQMQDIKFSVQQIPTMCAVGGTARAALKLYNMLHGNSKNVRYTPEFYLDYLSQIEMGPQKLTGSILKSSPDRIHTLTPGITVFQRIANTFGVQNIVTSPYGVREGFLYRQLQQEGIISAPSRT